MPLPCREPEEITRRQAQMRIPFANHRQYFDNGHLIHVARDERVGMIQPVRVRHPPEPPRDGPVIQAVHQILPVLGPETAK